MKKIIFLAVLFNSLNSCKNNDEMYSLDCINSYNKLDLTFVDDKFGEWGGNEKTILVYKDSLEGMILADFTEINRASANPNSKTSIVKKSRILLNQKQKNLVIKSVAELSYQKLNNKMQISHAGLFCRVMLSDSSLFIKVYPAKKWKNFNILSDELKNQKQ